MIAVTGANGGLGGAFVSAAKERGVACAPLTRNDADLAKPDEIRSALLRIKPDVIVHSAAMTAVDLCEKERALAHAINVEGTRGVARAARELGARVVYISTDYVFDGEKEAPYSPADAPNPLNVYGETKLEGEKIVLSTPGGAVARTSWLYSKNGKSFVNTVLNLAAKNDTIKMVNDQSGAPTYSPDLAQALLTLIEKKAEGVYHIANSGHCSWFEYAKKILELKNIGGVKVLPITSAELNRPARRPRNSRLDCSDYARLAGAPLRPWDAALAEMLSSP